MSRRTVAVLLGGLVAVLPLAGCAAGTKSATRSSTPTVPSATATTPAQTSTPGATTSIPASNGSATAVLPASFVVNADDSRSPPLVAAPVQTTIQLTITSHASDPVRVSVAAKSVSVQPGAHATARLPGLKAGRYTVSVDGMKRGALVVGAQPGP